MLKERRTPRHVGEAAKVDGDKRSQLHKNLRDCVGCKNED